MSTKKIVLIVEGPILAGTLSVVSSRCGKPQCRCHSGKATDLHGPYYRWSGYIKGRLTHRTLTEKAQRECERRIANYHDLQKQLAKAVEDALQDAPWLKESNPKKRK